MIVPAPSLAQRDRRDAFEEHVRAGGLAIAYLQDKLGGEVSLTSTDRSPELSFDITLIEAVPSEDGVEIGRFGVLEVQTMDFHGSYRHAVANLKDSLRLHQQNFAEVLQENRHWLSERIEGPNIANVFKRTFYQMMLKFEAGVHSALCRYSTRDPTSRVGQLAAAPWRTAAEQTRRRLIQAQTP